MMGWLRRLVSPGFRLRPSLSAVQQQAEEPISQVSPGFRLRPSLSDAGAVICDYVSSVSPGFRLRPSLSAGAIAWSFGVPASVAGV